MLFDKISNFLPLWGCRRNSIPATCISHHYFITFTYKYYSVKATSEISVWPCLSWPHQILTFHETKCVTQTLIPLCSHLPCHCTYLEIQLYRLNGLQEMFKYSAKLQSFPFLLCVLRKLQVYCQSAYFAYQKYSPSTNNLLKR